MATDVPAVPSPPRPLYEYWDVVRRHRRVVLAVTAAVAVAVLTRSLLTVPSYRATTKLLIDFENPSVLTFKEVAPQRSDRDDYYQTQYRLLQSRALAARTVEALKLQTDPEFGGAGGQPTAGAAKPASDAIIDAFLSRLRVDPVKGSRLVAVSFEASRPQLAADAANRLAQLYIQQSLEFRYQTSAEAARWLAGQIDGQRRQVEGAERDQQALKETDGIVNIKERRVLLDQKLKELGSALTGLKTQRLEKQALVNSMRAARNPEELPDVVRSTVVQALRLDLAARERDYAQLLERYLDRHPLVVRAQKEVADTRRRIAAEIERIVRAAENDYRAALAQEESVASALEAAKQEALDLSRRAVRYDSLERDLEARKGVLDSLLARHRETDVARELKDSNIRIVDVATVPRRPERPRHGRDVSMGIVLGLLLGLGAAFVLDRMDRTVKTPDDVRTRLGLPLLGVIPDVSRRLPTPLLPAEGAEQMLAESCRAVRTALQYCWPERGARCVLVTSTVPGEGKTVTAVNLAVTLAAGGGKVLFLDADLRRPRGHALLGFARGPGLSDVLVDVGRFATAVRRNGRAGLDVLTAGRAVPSPADLLMGPTVKAIVDEALSAYDWVVIDTPPVSVVTDALILAPLSHGVILVAGAESAPRDAIRFAVERLIATRARLLGVVLNRVREIPRAYYSYGSYGDPTSGPRPAEAGGGGRGR